MLKIGKTRCNAVYQQQLYTAGHLAPFFRSAETSSNRPNKAVRDGVGGASAAATLRSGCCLSEGCGEPPRSRPKKGRLAGYGAQRPEQAEGLLKGETRGKAPLGGGMVGHKGRPEGDR